MAAPSVARNLAASPSVASRTDSTGSLSSSTSCLPTSSSRMAQRASAGAGCAQQGAGEQRGGGGAREGGRERRWLWEGGGAWGSHARTAATHFGEELALQRIQAAPALVAVALAQAVNVPRECSKEGGARGHAGVQLMAQVCG